MNTRRQCELLRPAIHARLDGESLEPADLSQLEAHLAECEPCREFDGELRTIQTGLRSLPTAELPHDVLQRVLSRTGTRSLNARLPAWAAIAAAMLIVVLAGWRVTQQRQRGPTDAELARASQQARVVLKLAADALRRTERIAFHDVVGDELGAALRRAPVEWPDTSAVERRGS